MNKRWFISVLFLSLLGASFSAAAAEERVCAGPILPHLKEFQFEIRAKKECAPGERQLILKHGPNGLLLLEPPPPPGGRPPEAESNPPPPLPRRN